MNAPGHEDKVPRFKLIAVEHQNPWFSVRRHELASPAGPRRYYSVHHDRPAVGIVARRQNAFLFIRQYRPLIEQFVWAIPSGGVEPGETPTHAAARELLEETGYRARRITHLQTYYPTYGCSDQRFETFLAEVDEPESTFDPEEVLDTRWFSRNEVEEMILRNQIKDGLSLTPLLQVLIGDQVAGVR